MTGGYHMLNDSKTDKMLCFRIETVHGSEGTMALAVFQRQLWSDLSGSAISFVEFGE
jgi:hypothetical protein